MQDFSVASVVPRSLLGPIDGGTVVELLSKTTWRNSRVSFCVFGTVFMPVTWINATTISCQSPPVTLPATVAFRMSSDGQNAVPLGPNGTDLNFTYYFPPSAVSTVPSVGATMGGTLVQIIGSHFYNSTDLACKFGDSIVPVVTFISSNQIVCRTPPGQ